MNDLINMGADVTFLILMWFIPVGVTLMLLIAIITALLTAWATYRNDKEKEGRG